MPGGRRFLASRWDAGRFWRRGSCSGGSRSLRNLHHRLMALAPSGRRGDIFEPRGFGNRRGGLGDAVALEKVPGVWLCDLRW